MLSSFKKSANKLVFQNLDKPITHWKVVLLSSNPWLLSLSWLDIRLRFGKIATVFLNRWEKGSGEHFYGIFLRDAWSNLIYTGPILVSQVRTVMLWKRLLCATRIKLLCDSIQACIWAGLLQWDICKQNKASQCWFFYRFAFGKDSIQLSKVLWIKIQSLLMGVVWMVYTLPHSRV